MSAKMTQREFDEALDAAKRLAEEYGVLLHTLSRAKSRGEWVMDGGMSGTGYNKPLTGFQDRLVPGDLAALDRVRDNPRLALIGLVGRKVDVLDPDVQHNGHLSHAALVNAGRYPRRIVARVKTPSGGWHDFTPTMNIGSPTREVPSHHGIDLKGGLDGVSKGWVFLPPTRKLSKITGELERYRYLMLPGPRRDHRSLDKGARAFVEDIGGAASVSRVAANHPDDIAVVWADQPRTERQRLDRVRDAILDAELVKLTALVPGEPWNPTIHGVACNLIEVGNSPHYDYSLESARADFLFRCPRDGRRYTETALGTFWESVQRRLGGKAKPYPLARPAAIEPDLQFNYVPGGAR